MMEPQHYYANVKEQHNDDDSSTEVESLVGRKQWDDGDYQSRAPPTRRNVMCPPVVAALKWVLVIGLQLIIIGLLAKDQGLLSKRFGIEKAPLTSQRDVGGDITGWSPHLPTQLTTFKVNQTFAPYNTSEFFKPEVLQAWNELMPIGMGFQAMPNPEDYDNLPTPISWTNGTVFTTSMTHQLHCLYAVVAVYSSMTSGHEMEENHHWHMIHCFDYLRQAILCSADMALEGLETTFPDHNGGSDGWDSKHVCKDPRAVRERLESVRAYDDQQIF
ncbi:Thioesterase domain-containing [Pyrenophora seminiperda CCB06]|uniref:Thioesterase domain-containing n=1 Tax=Pyrenophora seminiperda CCB06 TaxID=1302712 RepID=A0A3M7LZU3_9PLEO|nr:Thioesterase domain-containing [Pyrenophora seminiperda CCB06]